MSLEGILVIDKPTGMTSHDVVAKVRRQFKIKKVGHAGTLDPLATGVLVLLIGKATKLSNKFMDLDKAYESTLLLGTKTDSADTQGNIISQKNFENASDQEIKDIFSQFQGEIQQNPPMYCAVKIKGKKLYELARKGMVVERQARTVTIQRLDITEIDKPEVKFYMECSKGTYVRQVADDIGDKLGCGACISQLRRTKVGSFTIEQSKQLEDIHERDIRSWEN